MSGALLLAGCASPPRASDDTGWTSGRLSLRVAATSVQPAQDLSADFELRGNAEGGELNLDSRLGMRLASARWSASEATLRTGDGERRFAGLDELAREALGEAVPLAALPDWLAGRPWPAAASRTTATGFEQLGWQVDTSRRDQGWIAARRDAEPVILLKIRIELPETSASAASTPSR